MQLSQAILSMIEISNIIIKILRLIVIVTFSDLIMSQGHPYLDNFVSNHILLTKSKMESSPMYWQDFRESYYRARAVRYSDSLLDSLNNGISSYEIAMHKLPELEFFKKEALSGKKFKYNIKQAKKVNFSVNYFSTSID